MNLTHFSLFTGIGGIDLAAEWAGFETVGQCEINKTCLEILNRHWPDVPKWGDIRDVVKQPLEIKNITVVSGGDPCPVRSRARRVGKCSSPDLSGYFLAVVGQMRPGWVVRENVPASDDVDFATGLGCLGYRAVIIRTDAGPVTGQNRQRDFIVGCVETAKLRQLVELPQFAAGQISLTASVTERQVIPCLTTRADRYDTRDCYIWDGQLRILDSEERERLAG